MKPTDEVLEKALFKPTDEVLEKALRPPSTSSLKGDEIRYRISNEPDKEVLRGSRKFFPSGYEKGGVEAKDIADAIRTPDGTVVSGGHGRNLPGAIQRNPVIPIPFNNSALIINSPELSAVPDGDVRQFTGHGLKRLRGGLPGKHRWSLITIRATSLPTERR